MNRKPSRFLIGFAKVTGYLPALLFFKWKVYKEAGATRRLPKPCILVSNHRSLMDFVLYLCMFPGRTLRFLMAEVLFNKGRAFSRFLYALGGIKVDRDAYDFGFIGESLEVLDRGGIVGIFPESRLPVNGVPFPFKSSVVEIALHTDAPIIPVYTDGSYGLFKRAHVVIGAPIYLSDLRQEGQSVSAERAALTQYLQDKVYSLRDLIQ
ncbi:MAG: 1-acyl-sn-glycerol-3-phosphate acyltransferase [Oscillospiraceae bacterium]|nr:1-acyl-sn-glycerol-3-phosphate acyltransferase [Oscillospiraceae bacterium]